MLWRFIREHCRDRRGAVLAVIALHLVVVGSTLALPALNARIIDDGVSAGDLGVIWRFGGWMLVSALVQVAAALGAVWLGTGVAMELGRNLRMRVYDAVDGFDSAQLARFGPGPLATRSTLDVNQVQLMMLMLLNVIVVVPLMIAGGVIMAVREDPGLSWLVWASIPILALGVGLLVWRLLPLFGRVQGHVDDVNSTLREQILGAQLVRAFVRERHEAARFDLVNDDLTGTSLRIGRIFVLMGPVVVLVLQIASVAVLWFGAGRVQAGALDIGALIAFLQYLLQILTAVMMGTFMVMLIPRSVVSARRIGEVLAEEPGHPRLRGARGEPAAPGAVVFHEVSYSFDDAEAPVLDRIAFRADAGSTTAVIGATGAGKTTLARILTGLVGPTAGIVTVGGVPLHDLDRSALSATTAVVPQQAHLFDGTIADNLRLGAPAADDAHLWDCLRAADADTLVRERVSTGPDGVTAGGLQASIAAGGADLSGGQRQRLCIARALTARPAVLVLDDSFTALDARTEERVRRGVEAHVPEAARIILTQRVATARDADRIVMLEAGRVVADGSHDELLACSPHYRELAQTQTQQEVLA